MDNKFWLERWEQNQIGFHEAEVNPYLSRYWSTLNLPSGSLVFVPLCGKSVDMKWLSEHRYNVLGVEFSKIAAQDFFKENDYTVKLSVKLKFTSYETKDIRILCGDFFGLNSSDLVGVNAVYDRASIVAFPLNMREAYVQHLVKILPAKSKIFLITFDYPQMEMQGPPFAISEDQVNVLFEKHAEIKLLTKEAVLPQNPRFKKRGLTRLHECVYILSLF